MISNSGDQWKPGMHLKSEAAAGAGGPGPGAGGGQAPHQARRGGRGGMARAAAGQERSPRPPSGRGAHGSGSARSQLALASRLSSIRLWALLRRPVPEPERSAPGGSAPSGSWGATARSVRAARGTESFSVPIAARATGGRGRASSASRTFESPRLGSSLEPASAMGPGSARPRGRGRRSPGVGVGVGLFTRSFRGAVKGTRLGGSLGGRGGASSGPRRSRHRPDPHSAQVGRRVPGAAVLAGQPPGPAVTPSPPNLPFISRGACTRGLTQRLEIAFQTRLQRP